MIVDKYYIMDFDQHKNELCFVSLTLHVSIVDNILCSTKKVAQFRIEVSDFFLADNVLVFFKCEMCLRTEFYPKISNDC